MKPIDNIIDETTDLAPLSPTVVRLAKVVGDEKSSVQDAVSVIAYDQALTADVLRLANSVMSASSRRIDTVRQAVIRLGGARILERVIATHVKQNMAASLTSYGYEEQELWHHSVCAACASELLNGFVDASISGLSFSAALLHDIGKLLISREADKKEIERIIARSCDGPCAWADAEREILGYSHADIGAALCRRWGLPAAIVEAIQKHHDTVETAGLVTDSVRIANITAKCIGVGIGSEGMRVTLEYETAERLGLKKEDFEKLCAGTATRYTTLLESFTK